MKCFGINSRHVNGDASRERLMALCENNMVLLRILAGGYAKHWIMAWKQGDNSFRTADPSSGKSYAWEQNGLMKHWGARDGEAVVIPISSEKHDPLPENIDLPKPWISLPEESESGWMIEAEAPMMEHWPEAKIEEAVQRSSKDGYVVPLPVQSYNYPNLMFLITGGWGIHEHMIVRNIKGELVGGIVQGRVWVRPEFRFQGIGKEMLWVASRPENAVHATFYPVNPIQEKSVRFLEAVKNMAIARNSLKNNLAIPK
jgi:GNAT superfamily N-acetyltransferase